MTTDDSTFSPQASAVHMLADDLRAAGLGLDTFVNRQLDVMAALLCKLDEREDRLDARRDVLDEQAGQLDRRERSLAALRQLAEQGAWRVQQEAERLARSRLEQPASGAPPGASASPISSADPDAARIREALHEAEARLAAMAGLAHDLNAARRDIVRLQTRLMKQANRLAEAKGHFANAASGRIQQLESERATLALELGLVRGQLEQQAARVENSRRARAQERGVWLGEIKRMRQALEQSALASHSRESPLSYVPSEDASLDEIVARLEKLQNEIDESALPAIEAAQPMAMALDVNQSQPASLAEETTRSE